MQSVAKQYQKQSTTTETRFLKQLTMLKFKKKFSGHYEAKTDRYSFNIICQLNKKEWVLIIQDHFNKSHSKSFSHKIYKNKKTCVEHANNLNN